MKDKINTLESHITQYREQLKQAQAAMDQRDRKIEEILAAAAESKNGYMKLLETKDRQISKMALDLRMAQDKELSTRSFLSKSIVDYEKPLQQSTPLFPSVRSELSNSNRTSSLSKPPPSMQLDTQPVLQSSRNTKRGQLESIYDEIDSLQRKITARLQSNQ